MNPIGIIKGRFKIKKYIKNILPSLKITNDEVMELLEIIHSKYNSKLDEIDLLKEIINFLDKRPLFTRNLLNIQPGVYRTMEGNADELIVVGKLIKLGFNCSRVDVTNSKYDAVIDRDGRLLRIQIKATGTNSLNLTCGSRAGQQISRDVPSRERKLTEDDCDILIGVSKDSTICYVIPAKDLSKFGKNVSLTNLRDYKENWDNIN